MQEYIEGKPLSAIISNQQLYTPEQVKEIILKLLEVLVYLQTEFTDPVLHRDLKPANILIDTNNEPYLIDFGGAKVSEGEGGSTVAIGTLGFMPPEQRFQQFNKTTDIYRTHLRSFEVAAASRLSISRIKQQLKLGVGTVERAVKILD